MQTITRKDAKLCGLKRYFTGTPCLHGHISERYTSTARCVECDAGYYSRNTEKAKASRKAYYDKTYNSRKEAIAASNKKWRTANPGKRNALTSERRAAVLARVPNWANKQAIVQFYEQCPSGHQVDHIVPLRGKLVSGLHVENNLQYLPTVENLSKVNKWDPMSDSERLNVD